MSPPTGHAYHKGTVTAVTALPLYVIWSAMPLCLLYPAVVFGRVVEGMDVVDK